MPPRKVNKVNRKSNHDQDTHSTAERGSSISGKPQPFLLQIISLFLLSFLLYANTIGFSYTLDDAIVITDNQFTKKGFEGIKDILTKDTFFGFFGENKQLVSGGRYRPLSVVTFAIEYELFGPSPAISHFINVLLYGLTGIVLLLFLYELFPAERSRNQLLNLPFLAGLLFIAHPLHTEVVANIKGRDEIMCFLGAFSALYFLFRYIRTKGKHHLAISLILYFAALLSKENAITFLAVIPAALYFFASQSIRKIALLCVPYLAVAGVFWYMRGAFTNSSVTMEVTEVLNNPFVYMTKSEKFATIVFTLGKYLWLLIFPHPLSHDYYYNQITVKHWSDASVILTLLIYAAIILYTAAGTFKKHPLAFAGFFYLTTFSVVSNLFFPIGTTMSERFLYVSSFGFSLVSAHFLLKLKKRPTPYGLLAGPGDKALLIAGGIILAAYSLKTVTRNEAWSDNYTLFKTDIKTSPNSAKLRNSMGGETMAVADREQDTLKKKVLLQEAITHLNKALEIYPNYAMAWLLLGNAHFKYNLNYDKAIECYRNSLSLNSNSPDAHYNLAITLKQSGRHDEALSAFRTLLTFRPDNPGTYNLMGDIYKAKNQPDSAIWCFMKVASIDPKFPGIYREIGSTYGQMKGDLDNAIAYLQKAVEAEPKDQTAWENLGIAYGFKKDYQNALKTLQKALEINPNSPNLYRNLGVTYTQIGEPEKARACFAKAQELMK
jgi:protein O-mannosyl-transferase